MIVSHLRHGLQILYLVFRFKEQLKEGDYMQKSFLNIPVNCSLSEIDIKDVRPYVSALHLPNRMQQMPASLANFETACIIPPGYIIYHTQFL